MTTLDADSFINGLRHFIARREMPKKRYPDNGTNFVSGEKELRQSFEEIISSATVRAYIVARGTEWSFTPPSAPHMGGVWERMVGVIKRILSAFLKDVTQLND